MAKKHRRYIPQKRFRQHDTVGHLKFVNVVYMEKERIQDDDTGEVRERIYATCTCGWRSSAEASTIAAVAAEAKAHVDSSGGNCRLRQHAAGLPQGQSGDADSNSEATGGTVSEAFGDGNGVPDPLSEEALS